MIQKLRYKINTVKSYTTQNPTSNDLEEWVKNLKASNAAIEKLNSLEELINQDENLNKLILKQEQIAKIEQKANEELRDSISESQKVVGILKDYLSEYMTSELAPGLIEQIKNLENALEKKNKDDLIQAKNDAVSFIDKNILEPIRKAEEEKRKAEAANLHQLISTSEKVFRAYARSSPYILDQKSLHRQPEYGYC